jgi:hypothetical protein
VRERRKDWLTGKFAPYIGRCSGFTIIWACKETVTRTTSACPDYYSRILTRTTLYDGIMPGLLLEDSDADDADTESLLFYDEQTLTNRDICEHLDIAMREMMPRLPGNEQVADGEIIDGDDTRAVLTATNKVLLIWDEAPMSHKHHLYQDSMAMVRAHGKPTTSSP